MDVYDIVKLSQKGLPEHILNKARASGGLQAIVDVGGGTSFKAHDGGEPSSEHYDLLDSKIKSRDIAICIRKSYAGLLADADQEVLQSVSYIATRKEVGSSGLWSVYVGLSE